MIGAKFVTSRKGFTLMEAVVVMSIFVIFMTAVSGIYLLTSRFGRQIVSRAKLQADVRVALEAVSRAVRVSNIDYAAYGGTLPPQPMAELRLVNPSTGDASRIKIESLDADCYGDGTSFPCLSVSTDGGNAWAPLSPRGVNVESLRFYASPARDPFLYDRETGTYASDGQPLVTVFLNVRKSAPRPSDEWSFALQTTVTPRLYLR